MALKSAPTRSQIMASVKSKNTRPEMAVRALIYSLGFRYRLHRRDLPGKPDLVFGRLKKVIFIHGCFWHGHFCKAGRNVPNTNLDYWSNKLKRNQERDSLNIELLQAMGWKVLVIWECEIKEATLTQRIKDFLYE